jgi:hypothetical protein
VIGCSSPRSRRGRRRLARRQAPPGWGDELGTLRRARRQQHTALHPHRRRVASRPLDLEPPIRSGFELRVDRLAKLVLLHDLASRSLQHRPQPVSERGEICVALSAGGQGCRRGVGGERVEHHQPPGGERTLGRQSRHPDQQRIAKSSRDDAAKSISAALSWLSEAGERSPLSGVERRRPRSSTASSRSDGAAAAPERGQALELLAVLGRRGRREARIRSRINSGAAAHDMRPPGGEAGAQSGNALRGEPGTAPRRDLLAQCAQRGEFPTARAGGEVRRQEVRGGTYRHSGALPVCARLPRREERDVGLQRGQASELRRWTSRRSTTPRSSAKVSVTAMRVPWIGRLPTS